jgi:hypothetical protein
MKFTKRTRQVLCVALAGLASAATAAAACPNSPLNPEYLTCRAKEKLENEAKELKKLDDAAKGKGFADAADQTAKLAAVGYFDAAQGLAKYANAAEIATYDAAARAQGYRNLAFADARAFTYGGYASLKARLNAESLPITAADVEKLKTAYFEGKAVALTGYRAASPYLRGAVADGTKLWDLISHACISGAKSSAAAAQSTVNTPFQAMKALGSADTGLVNQITRALVSGKAGDETLVAAMKQIGKSIGILKPVSNYANASDYGASTWGISVSSSAAWGVGASQTFSFNMNTAPFSNGRYGFSVASVTGPTFVIGTRDLIPGVAVAIGLSVGTGDSTLANEGISFAYGVSGGPFSAEMGWVFPNPKMDSVRLAFDAVKTAEQAMIAATKKNASGKDLLNAAYKTGHQAFDAAMGPLQSTIATLCSVPGITGGLGINFGADVATVPGYSTVLWSGTI